MQQEVTMVANMTLERPPMDAVLMYSPREEEAAHERHEVLLAKVDSFRSEVSKAVVGLDGKTEWATAFSAILIGFVSGRHTFLIGPSGEGKTLLTRSMAQASGLSFARLAGSPEMLPSEVIGFSIETLVDGVRQFVFRPGRLFHQVFFFDEANGCAPGVFTALRTPLEERRYDDPYTGQEYEMPEPNAHIWAINPTARGATFEIPQPVYDRFLMSVWLGRPDEETLDKVLRMQDLLIEPENLCPQFTAEDLEQARKDLRILYPSWRRTSNAGVKDDNIARSYIRRIAMATRTHQGDIRTYYKDTLKGREVKDIKDLVDPQGISTRAAAKLYEAARTHAYLEGAKVVTEAHVRHVVTEVLRLRFSLSTAGLMMIPTADRSIDKLINYIVDSVKVI